MAEDKKKNGITADEIIKDKKVIANIEITVVGMDNVTVNEAVNYINFLEEKIDKKKEKLTSVIISNVEGKEGSVSLDWTVKPRKFERIRRITGYLVGDLSRWNAGKLAEEKDRVKHIGSGR